MTRSATTLLIAIFALFDWFVYHALAQQVLPPNPTIGNTCAYNTTLPTITPGFAGWVQCDSGGRLITVLGGSPSSLAANSHAVTSSLTTSLVLKASAGNFYTANTVGAAGAGYLVLVNATAAPSTGAITPIDFCYFTGPGGCSLSHPTPINYSTGITALITSAGSPYTYTTGVLTAAISGDYQ